MTRLVPALCLAALLAGPARASRIDPTELVWNAESAYRQGELEQARGLALEAIQLDGGLATLGARRLLVEIALRTDQIDDAQHAIDAFGRVSGVPDPERAWLDRARTRQLTTAALLAEDLATASDMVAKLQGQRGLMLPAEQAWLAWTQTRLDALTLSAFGRYDEATKALNGVVVPKGSPEAQWRAAMQRNISLHEYEARCSWSRAKAAARSIESAHGADAFRRRWAETGAARIGVREAVSRNDHVGAQQALTAMARLPGLTANDRAWVSGYSAWLERQTALMSGGDVPTSVIEAATEWQEMFPGERGCEATPLSSPWTQGPSPSRDAPVSWASVRPTPPSIRDDLNVAASALLGAATCRDATQQWSDEDDGADVAAGDEDQTLLRAPALGATVDATWTPISLGVPPRIGASINASVLVMRGGLTMFDTWIGPSLAWDRLVLTAGGGGRSASRTDDDGLYCEGLCPKSGDPIRQQFINGYLGVEGRGTLPSRLELSARVGGGLPINNGFDRVLVAGGDVRWTPWPESPLYFGFATGLTVARHYRSLGDPNSEAQRTVESWTTVSIALQHEGHSP